jgi:hypothetical protein
LGERVSRGLRLIVLATLVRCQVLDPAASSGSPVEPPAPPSNPPLTTAILPGPPPFAFFDEMGVLVTSNDPCDATRTQAIKILTKDCAGCHGGRTPGERAGVPPFDFVLDPAKLTTTYTNNTTPPMLFVAPGDPDHSRVYVRVRRGEMPPPSLTLAPRPTVSDLSVFYEWISNCIAPKSPPGIDGGGSSQDGGAPE